MKYFEKIKPKEGTVKDVEQTFTNLDKIAKKIKLGK